jgi:uncharacterized protein (DUF1778 family)
MLGIDVWGAVTTPEQLRAAIDVHGKHENLYAILRKNGLMSQEPETTPSFSEAAGTALSERVGAVASNLTRRDRNQALDKYEPGDEPMQVNAIPPPKEKPAEQSYGEKEVAKIADTYAATDRETRNPFFEDAAYEKADTGYKSRRKVVDMSIEDFLRMAQKLDRPNPESEQIVRELLEQGKPFSSLPTLMFDNDGQGVATVKGHEGRHRGMGLANQGQKTMPVVLESVGKNPIRWSEQSDTKNFDRVKGEWPSKLRTQSEESGEEMDFPVSDPSQKPGIVMPSDDVSNEDASQGDQLGLFGEGKKKKVPKKYKQDNPQGKARAKSLFDKDEDPDQQTLFSSWGEAVEYYSMQKKK